MSVFKAGVEQALAKSAVFEVLVFKALELLIEEMVRLVDETDRDNGDSLGWRF